MYRIFQGEEGSVCYNLHRPVYAFGLDDLLVKAKTKMKCTHKLIAMLWLLLQLSVNKDGQIIYFSA
jgi:hypothetical protein